MVLALLAACSERLDPVGDGPPGDPNAPRVDATVEGRVVDLGDRPQSGVSVEVRSRPSAAEHSNAFLAFLFTGGFACFAGACNPATAASQTVTGPDGGFRTTLPKAHLPGFETDTDWFVTASRPPPAGHVVGATSGDEFEVAAPVHRPPKLPLWLTAPTVTVTGDGIRATWEQIDPDVFEDGEVRYSLAFLDGRRAPVWRVGLARPDQLLDPRVLEDTQGSVAVAVRGQVTVGETVYHRTIAAPQPRFEGPAGPPPSRNAPCQIDDAPSGGSCWLTDGDLVMTGPSPVTSVVITVPDLRADLLVLRGCPGCNVEVSGDGTAWRSVTPDHQTGLAVLPPTTPVRLVRVRAEMGQLQRASELSVWPARPPRKQMARPSPDGFLPESDGRSGRDWLVIGLGLALLLVAGAWVLSAWKRSARVRAPRP